jgi:hypothetical protein
VHQRGVILRGGRDSRRAASERSGFFPKGSGARIDSDRRRLWAKEVGVASRRAGGSGLGGSSPGSFGCEAGEPEEGSRRRRQRRRSQTTSSSEYLDEWIERSRRSKLVCVNRRVSRTNRGRLRQVGRATEARVQRGREKFGWHPLVGSICGAPLVSARESRQQESV